LAASRAAASCHNSNMARDKQHNPDPNENAARIGGLPALAEYEKQLRAYFGKKSPARGNPR